MHESSKHLTARHHIHRDVPNLANARSILSTLSTSLLEQNGSEDCNTVLSVLSLLLRHDLVPVLYCLIE